MNEAVIISTMRGFIQDNFLYMKPGVQLSLDDSLLRKGIVDSMGILEVLVHLEETFAIAVSDDEVTEVNLGSLRAITHFVLSKRADAAAA